MFIKSFFFFGKNYPKNCFQIFKKICQKLVNIYQGKGTGGRGVWGGGQQCCAVQCVVEYRFVENIGQGGGKAILPSDTSGGVRGAKPPSYPSGGARRKGVERPEPSSMRYFGVFFYFYYNKKKLNVLKSQVGNVFLFFCHMTTIKVFGIFGWYCFCYIKKIYIGIYSHSQEVYVFLIFVI